MKKFFTFSFLILLFVSSVYSQDVKPTVDKYNLLASVGASFCVPMDVMKESYTYGIGGTMDIAIPFSKNIAGRVELSINDFIYDKSAFDGSNSTVTGGNALLIAMKLNFCGGIFKPSEKFAFYGLAGVGAYFVTSQDLVSTDNTTTLETRIGGSAKMYMGLNAGVRGAYKIHPKASIFLETGVDMYFGSESWYKVTTNTRNDWYVPIKLGVMIHTF
jgi:hypothetical protein